MARKNRNGVRKEVVVMLASSVLVLTALTVTGIFVKGNNRAEKEDYVVDLEAIEKEADEPAGTLMTGEELDTLFAEVGTDDLDYDPSFQEANSLNVENTDEKKAKDDKTKKNTQKNGKDDEKEDKDDETALGADESSEETALGEDEGSEETASGESEGESAKKKESGQKKTEPADKKEEDEEAGMFDETVDTAKIQTEPEEEEVISTTVQPALDFSEEDGLVWPIVGDVLINYSMDKTIYFPTLEQYKYNPAIVIAAAVGENITAAADGKVTSVAYDPMIGNTVVMDLGNGYELTYGQLENITVSEGSYVTTGDIIGTVASPTKYYSLEGSNVYFKLLKDGAPVNPMSKLQ